MHRSASADAAARRPVSHRFLPLLGLALAALAVLLLSGSAGAAPNLGRPESARLDVVPPDGDGRIPIVLETSDAAGLAARVEELGGTVTWVFENIDGLSALVPPAAMEVLFADSRVGSVHRQRFVHRATVPIDIPTPLDGPRRRAPEGEILPLDDPSGVRARTIPLDELRAGVHPRGVAPSSYLGYDLLTGAADSWEVADHGAGVTVAIIDTGVYPMHPLIFGNVVGGMNLVPAAEEEAIDLDEDGTGDGRSFDWDAVSNHYHGTFVGGLVAGHAALESSEDDPFIQSVAFHSPESVEFDGEGGATLLLMGAAPAADLYGVKVFPYDGGSAPDARVAEAVDRLITMRRTGELDVDIINMSLSGAVLHDGWNPLDLTVAKATFFGITVVSSASNDGPALVTVGSPASAFTGLAVGGAMDPIHTRVAIETFFGQDPGFGNLVYPPEGLMVADFSSRGLTADGRVKPDLLATGFLVFSGTLFDLTGDGVNDVPSFGFSSGTSFSAPTVAGAAALVTAYADANGCLARAPFVGNALKRAAIPIAPYPELSQREQGRGFVNVPAAIDLMESGHVHWGGHGIPAHHAKKNLNLAGGSCGGSTPPLPAGETYHFFVKIPRGVSNVSFQVTDVALSGMPNPVFGDEVVIVVHSAKRGGANDYVFGDQTDVAGASFEWPYPEPGTARVTMLAPFPNGGEVSAAFEMTAEFDELESDGGETFRGFLRRDGLVVHTVDVPAGLEALALRLAWKHDWSRYPTYDLDLLVETPEGVFPFESIDSPELGWIEDPPAGEWTFRIADVGTVLRREKYRLDVAFLEEGPGRDHVAELFDDDRPRLLAATPNPFVGATEVKYAMPRNARARVTIYDVTGRTVRTLVDGPQEAGEHVAKWDGRAENDRIAAAGVYFLRLQTPEGTTTRKIVKSR